MQGIKLFFSASVLPTSTNLHILECIERVREFTFEQCDIKKIFNLWERYTLRHAYIANNLIVRGDDLLCAVGADATLIVREWPRWCCASTTSVALFDKNSSINNASRV